MGAASGPYALEKLLWGFQLIWTSSWGTFNLDFLLQSCTAHSLAFRIDTFFWSEDMLFFQKCFSGCKSLDCEKEILYVNENILSTGNCRVMSHRRDKYTSHLFCRLVTSANGSCTLYFLLRVGKEGWTKFRGTKRELYTEIFLKCSFVRSV